MVHQESEGCHGVHEGKVASLMTPCTSAGPQFLAASSRRNRPSLYCRFWLARVSEACFLLAEVARINVIG